MFNFCDSKLADSQEQFGNSASDVAQEAVLPGEGGFAEGGEEQDVPSRSAPTDGRLAGNPLERSRRADWQPEPTEPGAGGIAELLRPACRQRNNPLV